MAGKQRKTLLDHIVRELREANQPSTQEIMARTYSRQTHSNRISGFFSSHYGISDEVLIKLIVTRAANDHARVKDYMARRDEISVIPLDLPCIKAGIPASDIQKEFLLYALRLLARPEFAAETRNNILGLKSSAAISSTEDCSDDAHAIISAGLLPLAQKYFRNLISDQRFGIITSSVR